MQEITLTEFQDKLKLEGHPEGEILFYSNKLHEQIKRLNYKDECVILWMDKTRNIQSTKCTKKNTTWYVQIN